jgi:hypothetical protein
MSWNHRVIEAEDGSLGMHECFYNEGDEIPHSWTAFPVEVTGDTIPEVAMVLVQMTRAMNKPTLTIYTDDAGDEHLREVE